MDKITALKLIDDHKNKLINPVEMLDWVWLRVIINSITRAEWEQAVKRATKILSQ